MSYHASRRSGIRILEPHVSNHGVPLIYFSDRRENVLPYLSNAVAKYCRETGFARTGPWTKWASYGFTADGRLRLEEYYPNATEETYRGVSGFIYQATRIIPTADDIQIPHAFATAQPVAVKGCEFIPDAYQAILEAERAGLIEIARYEKLAANPDFVKWIRETILREYREAADRPEYRHFLRGKFDFIEE